MKNLALLLFLYSNIATAQSAGKGFSFAEKIADEKVEVRYNGKLLTAYCYNDTIKKHVLFPINTVDGITLTRGYPIQPVTGERTDHPHHTGLWFNYESVNGLDFWNNSTAISPARRHLYGSIKHKNIVKKEAGKQKAVLNIQADWLQPDSAVLLKEETSYTFSVRGKQLFIDRVTTLTAQNKEVVFKDIKDGLLAIRVARELEMPNKQADYYITADGKVTSTATINNEGATGRYYSSEGLSGDAVWGTKGKWAVLTGKKEGKDVSIAILDHPSNVGYPTYWHARGYGLFSANPLGRSVFSNGKENLNFTLQPAQSATFRYRIIISSGEQISSSEMNTFWNQFTKEKVKKVN